MMADPSNPIFPANRAMAYLMLKKHAETEADCTLALSLDPSYTKAYLRRGAARVALGKTSSAMKDYMDALKLEPGNTQAKAEINKLKEMEKDGKSKKVAKPKNVADPSVKKSKFVHPIFIPPKERSKKPLMRVEVQELGFEEEKVTDYVSKEELDSILGRNMAESSQKPMTADHSKSLNTSASNFKGSNSVSSPKEDSKIAKAQQKILIEEVKSANQNSKAPEVLRTETKKKENVANRHQDEESNASRQRPIASTKPLSNAIPDRPTTSFQFQAHVKHLSGDLQMLLQYLLQISPESIPSLLKQQLETETLVPVLSCLKMSSECDLVLKYVTQFSKVKRFDMAVMFMSKDEQKEARSLFVKLKNSLPERLQELDNLALKYGL